MNKLKIEDIIPDKSDLRILVESYYENTFYQENKQSIEDELGLIEIHGLDEKLLIIKNSGIVKNTNNGNSYVSYLLGLTTVPPLGKLMTKGGSLPDIDIDFNAKRRDEVFAHLYEKYRDGFAHIGTHGTLQAKNAFKDVCRIFNVPFQEANLLSSLIPDNIETINEAMLDPKFAAKINESETLQDVLKYSSQLEGTIKSYGRHACISGNSIVTINGKQISIGEAYSLYGEKGTVVDIRTPYGDKKAIVVLGSYSKVYRLDCLDDNGLILTSLNLSANHEVLTGDLYSPKFTEYKKIVEDQQFRFSASFNENTDYVDDFFIAGFLLQNLKFDPLKGMVYPVPTGFNFGNYYNLGREAFLRSWGSITDAGTLFSKIRDICRLYVHTNGSILKYRSYDNNDGFIGYDKMFSETNFLNGLFSSLVTFGSNTESGIKRKYGYFHRHSDITKLGEIKDEVNDYLQRFNFQLSDNLLLTDEAFVKWTAANFHLTVNRDIVDQGEVFPGTPFISFAKGGKVSDKKEQLYDIQILSNDPKHQCYYANSIVVHNCSAFEIPLITENGLVPIGELDGLTTKILTPDGWKSAKIWSSGIKRVDIYRLGNISYGENVRFTEDHLIQSSNGEWKSLLEMSESSDFCISRTSPTYSSLDFLAGWNWNNGYVTKWNQIISYFTPNKDDEAFDILSNSFSYREEKGRIDKKVLIETSITQLIYDKYGEENFRSLNKDKLAPKYEIDLESLRSWLAGLFSANSSVIRSNILLILVSRDVIDFVKTSLSKFGISCSKIYSRKPKVVKFKNGDFLCKEQFVLTLNSVNSFKFLNIIGLAQSYKRDKIKSSKIYKISEGNIEPVYEFTILNEENRDNQCGYVNGHVFSNCGIVLSPVNLNESIPLYSDNGLPVTQYDGGTVEKLGFIKVDLLGVKVLSIIDESLKYINLNPKYSKISSVYDFPLDDVKTYNLLSSGETLGVFQLEGASVSPSVPLVKPDSIHDIAAMLGVWRPGPLGMSYDKMYIERKHNPDSSRDFYIPRYNHIFRKTYGLGIYQEQYMILLQEMCGFDPIKTDVWRKGVGRTVDFYSFL